MVQELMVQDMTCDRCATSVRKAVLQVAGVSGVEIDVPTRRVRVEASDDVAADTVVTAITATGYTEITLTCQEQASSVDQAATLMDVNGNSRCSCCN